MKSFFTQIKRYFNASYAGRYEEIVIQEASKECPAIITSLFVDYDSKSHSVELEYYYTDSRRADLAILNKQNNPVFLLEIKCEDRPLKGQLESYIQFAKKNKILFLCLTRHELSKKEKNLLDKGGPFVKHMFFSELCERLCKNPKVRNNAIGRFYIQYLRENGSMFTKINKDGLEKLLTRLLLPRNGCGRVRKTKDMVEIIPTTFKDLMSNMYFLNDKVGRKIACQMTIDFALNPIIKESEIKDENGCHYVESSEKIGGKLYVFSSGSFSKKRPPVVIEYGMFFDISINRKQKLICNYYCSIYAAGCEFFKKSNASLKDLSNYQVSERKISLLIKENLKQSLDDDKFRGVKKEFKAALKEFES